MLGLARICIVLVVIYVVSVVSTYIQNKFMVSTAQTASAAIRNDLFCNMQKLPLKYFDTHLVET